MKNKNQFRQGDVLVERTDALPKGDDIKKQKRGERVILAHGEVTGHAHEIDAAAADAWKTSDQVVAVTVKQPTELTHQEHAKIPLTPGKYRVVRQREYSPEAIRNVAD